MEQSWNSTSSDRDERFDLIRSYACVGVVVLHATGQFATSPATLCELASSAFHFLFRASVPLFFMTSGYFQLSRFQGGVLSYYAKRARRVWLPTLFWSVLYVALFALDRGLKGNEIDFADLLRDWFYFGKPGAGYHLWFLYALIPLDLLTPFVARFVARVSSSTSLVLSALIYLAFAIVTTRSLLRGEGGASDLFIGVLGLAYLSYFYWGYAFGRRLKKNAGRATLWLAALGFVASVLGMTATAWRWGGDYARNAFLPLCALQALSVYALATSIPIKRFPRLTRCVAWFAPLTFGVYLIHVATFPIFSRLFARLGAGENFATSIALAACALATSVVATILLRRVPYLRKLA